MTRSDTRLEMYTVTIALASVAFVLTYVWARECVYVCSTHTHGVRTRDEKAKTATVCQPASVRVCVCADI